mmetsp:Transcript_68412/g.222554  ORF Transcript_68412/g.222554 Transcript_68412/m.222554 type:complete len:897 (+) Transcript_68412:70-2760(+)
MTALSLVLVAVESRPDSAALRFLRNDRSLGSLTFRQIWNLSAWIAEKLFGDVLAVAIDDGPYLALAELAAWRRAMVLVPLDPHDPVARLRSIVVEAGAKCIVTKDWGDAKKFSDVGETLDLSLEVPLCTTDIAPSVADVQLDPDSAAYMWFTSGSTGTPKGVLISHRAFHNWCLVKNGPQGITSESVVLIASASTFDPSIGDIFATWAVGGQIAVAPRMLFFASLGWVMNQLEVTHVTCTPSLWQSLEVGASLERFTTLCLGGERSPQPLLDHWASNIVLLNTYGTTECTVWQTLRRMRSGDRAALVGKPYPGNEIKICPRGEITCVPDGELGEIVLGGVQVGLGYHNRPDLTQEKFISLPSHSGRWYRTGDGGRLVNGELEVMGRFDNQVKIRGMRVELGDIEAGVVKVAAGLLSSCVVVFRDTFLHAYCQVSPEAAIMMHESFCIIPVVSDFLLQQASLELPRHMLPSRFVLMQQLPLTTNGKVDSKRLPEVVEVFGSAATSLTVLEQVVAGVWGDVLGRTGVGPNDHFLALGGHSSSVLQVSRRLAALAFAAGQDVSPASHLGILLSPEKLIHSPRLRIYCQMLARGGVRFPGSDNEEQPGLVFETERQLQTGGEIDPAVANLRINYQKHKVKRPRTDEDEEQAELDHGAWEQVPQSSDGELLCRASEVGLLPLMRLLLNRGAPIEGDLVGQHLRHGLTPLHLATLSNHICCVEELLEGKADPKKRDAHGCFTLHKAAERCGTRMVHLLVAAGAETEAIDTASRSTALHSAARAGNLSTVQALIGKGVCLDWLDRWNRTALHWAAFHGHFQICQELVNARATLEGTVGEQGGRFLFSPKACGVLPQRVAKQVSTLETPLAIAKSRFGEVDELVGLLSSGLFRDGEPLEQQSSP